MIIVPCPSLVVLIGPAGAGKSTFAHDLASRMGDTQAVVATDEVRARVLGDEVHMQNNPREVHAVALAEARLRLLAGRSVIYDATSLKATDRRPLLELASQTGVPTVAVRFEVAPDEVRRRNASRTRVVPDHVVRKHLARLQSSSVRNIVAEGFDQVVLTTGDGNLPDSVKVRRSDGSLDGQVPGFDILGDVHGSWFTLERLLADLGYDVDTGVHPHGRTLVSVGDLVHRGAHSARVTAWASWLRATGRLIWVRGNHEHKEAKVLARLAKAAAAGSDPYAIIDEIEAAGDIYSMVPSLRETVVAHPSRWLERSALFRALPMTAVLDGGRLIVAHASVDPDLVGATNSKAESVFLYGMPTGEKTPEGYPVRADWQPSYTGTAFAVVGHSTVRTPRFVSAGAGSVNIDTGAGYEVMVDAYTGENAPGQLTAFRWPERTTLSVAVDRRDIA